MVSDQERFIVGLIIVNDSGSQESASGRALATSRLLHPIVVMVCRWILISGDQLEHKDCYHPLTITIVKHYLTNIFCVFLLSCW